MRSTAPTTTHRAVRPLVTLLTAGALALMPATPGHAADGDTDPVVTGISVRADGGPVTSSIAIDELYPTAVREAAVFLDGPRASIVRGLAVEVTDLVDLENGCNRPEITTGDTSCGDGDDEGELSQWLRVTFRSGVEVAGGNGRTCLLPDGAPEVTGLLSELAAAGSPSVVTVPDTDAGDVLCVVTAFLHEERGPEDNLTQTDSVVFDLTLSLSGDLPDTGTDGTDDGVEGTDGGQAAVEDDDIEVGGVVIERDDTTAGGREVTASDVAPAGRTLALGLPRTGAGLLHLLALGAVLLASGYWLAATRRRRPAPVLEVGP